MVPGLIYAGNIWGPPPPSLGALAGGALLAWLLAFRAAWVDRRWTFAPAATTEKRA